ncbi:MAG: chemotaxis protein CheB, partial [Sediminibacterium sp.]
MSAPAASTQDFPVIGTGASAGGLEAFTRLLKSISEDCGMAFVLVQHLHPTHESILPEILQRATKLPVHEITDDIHLAPNHIYVIPSAKILTTTDGVLKLTKRDEKTKNLLDIFFTSLAEVHKELAVGIVLSGTGKDGTEGLKAIRDHGGITIVQDPLSAAYKDMPQNAVNAGIVDFILSPEEIPAKLLLVTGINHQADKADTKSNEYLIKEILGILFQHCSVDFTYYKQNTIQRRILRRMVMNKQPDLGGYLSFLRSDKAEQAALFQDMLIPVTEFFRNPKTFEELCSKIFPLLFNNHPDDEPIRIWIAGCSTGEEAYSVAICLDEFLGSKLSTKRIQVFASDISETAIKKARTGIYRKENMQSLTEAQLVKYFTKIGGTGNYEVNKFLRDICVFAPHNFLKDPPFAKMDLISCRNVLIYMDNFLQKKALTTFHYALKKNGYLLLGKSETANGVSELFTLFSKSDKIYSRKDVPGRFMHIATERKEVALTAKNKIKVIPDAELTDFRKSAERLLLSNYTPASVVVDEQADIVHIHGNITAFLELSPGKPTFNLLKMARGSLGFELRNALHKAKTGSEPVIKENIPLKTEVSEQLVTIEVVQVANTIEPFYLVLFTKSITQAAPVSERRKKTAINDEAQPQIQQLKLELAQTREDMRGISQDQEAANEELQSANEELQSSNEEMQSLNEELETSKEELQSTNEELTIINQELLDKQDQLNTARLYSESIVSTIREPLIVLDKTLCIKTANQAFYKKFNISESETEGKMLYELQGHLWDDDRLRSLLVRMVPEQTNITDFQIELTFPSIGERILLMNARQVVNEKKSEQLILLAIEDITESILIQKKLQQSENKFRNLSDSIPYMIWTALPNGKLTYVNKFMLDYTGVSFDTLSGDESWEKIVSPLDTDKTFICWQHSIDTGEDCKIETRLRRSDRVYQWHLTQAIAQKNEEGKVIAWIGTHSNIEEQKIFSSSLEIKVKERTSELQLTNQQLNQFTYVTSHDLQEPLRKILTFSNRLRKDSAGLPEQSKTYITKIESTAIRMTGLIKDLLGYALSTDMEKLFEQTDLNQILKNVLDDFELLIAEKKAEIKSDQLPVIEVIPLQIGQLFTNLIGNALKFSKKGIAPIVTITSRILPASENSPERCEIIFRDNGIGFDQK